MEQIENCFSGVIGQDRCVNILTKAAKAVAHGERPLNIVAISDAGCGKTHLCSAYSNALIEAFKIRGENPLFHRFDPDDFHLKGPDYTLIRELLERSAGRPVILFVDECQNFSKSSRQKDKVWNCFKKIGDDAFWENDVKTIVFDEDLTLTINRKNICIIMATNLPNKLPDKSAVLSRFENIILDSYTEEAQAQILKKMLDNAGLSVDPETNDFELISKSGRGNVRNYERIRDYFILDMRAEGKRSKRVTRAQILNAMKDKELFPNGFTPKEVLILNNCPLSSEKNGYKLNALAIMTEQDLATVRTNVAYLQSKGFLNAQTSNVTCTKLGKDYLRAIHKLGFAWRGKNEEKFKEIEVE